MILLVVIPLIIIILYLVKRSMRQPINFTKKEVLVIGGTSGLGFAIAKNLEKKGALITVASRKKTKTHYKHIKIDITDLSILPIEFSKYDYIFCCAGYSNPGYFKNLDPTIYENQMKTNYIGVINSLYHYFHNNKRPFSFILIASTLSNFTFPGYSAYAPTKAALSSFYRSVKDELRFENVNMYIYYVNSIQTEGFENENKIKPTFTKEVEGSNGLEPDLAACILIDGMSHTNEIYSDLLTKILAIKSEAKSLVDFCLIPLALIFYPIIRYYVARKYARRKTK